jgi:bifunctional UDP-N-acetylglucosamine pyrophosphorylase / glucosamine-1-phosphate N-acetyltransferase
VLVVQPGMEGLFEAELRHLGWGKSVAMVFQAEATGSADAVALGLGVVSSEEPCVVVWADQVGVSQRTIGRVAQQLSEGARGVVLPLVEVENPYVWFHAVGNTVVVRRQRDGDVPPVRGKSDVGTFGLLAGPGRECIAKEMAGRPPSSRERDFVYVVPRLAEFHGLRVVEVDDPAEVLGVNSPADLEAAGRALAAPTR